MKCIMMIFSLLLLSLISSCENYFEDLELQAHLNDGLVAYWKVDASDTAPGSVRDCSDNGLNLILTGSVLISDDGKGSVLQYSSSSRSGSIDTNILANHKEFTISCWMKITDLQSNIIVGTDDFALILGASGIDIVNQGFYISGRGYAYSETIASDLSPHLSDWCYVTLLSSSSAIKLYINGNEVFSSSGSISTVGVTKLLIGAGIASASPVYWSGMLDEIRIYNRALSQDEIKALMDIGRD